MALKKKGLLRPGEASPENRVYACTRCSLRTSLLEGEIAPNCPNCDGKKHQWKPTRQTLLPHIHDVKSYIYSKSTWSDKLADKITAFCGNMTFVYVHCVWFALWIWYNLASKNPFDPYPFGFLTLVVSLEAIILATFILVSQNREGMVNDLRAELDYQVDLKNMKTIAEIRSLVSEKHEKPKSKKRKK